MKKDVTICFRTSGEISGAVKKIADEERQSISAIIETAIYNHLKEKKALQGIETDRRLYSRKQVSLPAFIMDKNSDGKEFRTGKVTDVSLGGIRLSVPRGMGMEITTDSETNDFHIVFTLPDATQALNLKCKPQRFVEQGEEMHIGAAFVDSDFNSYKTLQQYLI